MWELVLDLWTQSEVHVVLSIGYLAAEGRGTLCVCRDLRSYIMYLLCAR